MFLICLFLKIVFVLENLLLLESANNFKSYF